MKPKRFSAKHLYRIRNQVPIAKVIEYLLEIPSKTIQGTFRFRCPLCGQFDTAINPSTNLARCFSCKKNFNPIDMVMALRNTSFVESVNLLESFHTNLSAQKTQGLPKNHLVQSSCLSAPNGKISPSRQSGNDPVAIGDILVQLHKENQIMGAPPPQKTHRYIPFDPIANLQRDMESLAHQIKEIKAKISTLMQKK